MSTFTENDARLLDKTLQVREQLVDHLLKDPLPKAARDIDSFTNLLESIDRSVLGKAKIKIEDTNAKANEETKDILRSLLLDLHKNSGNHLNTVHAPRELPEYKSTEMNVFEGELIHKVDTLDVKSILEGQNN